MPENALDHEASFEENGELHVALVYHDVKRSVRLEDLYQAIKQRLRPADAA